MLRCCDPATHCRWPRRLAISAVARRRMYAAGRSTRSSSLYVGSNQDVVWGGVGELIEGDVGRRYSELRNPPALWRKSTIVSQSVRYRTKSHRSQRKRLQSSVFRLEIPRERSTHLCPQASSLARSGERRVQPVSARMFLRQCRSSALSAKYCQTSLPTASR